MLRLGGRDAQHVHGWTDMRVISRSKLPPHLITLCDTDVTHNFRHARDVSNNIFGIGDHKIVIHGTC